MTDKEIKLYNITKTKFGYKLSIIRDGDTIRSVRHLVNCAMKSSPILFSDYTYENVCTKLIDEIGA